MMEKPTSYRKTKKTTHLSSALANNLFKLDKPIISSYELFLEIWKIYKQGDTKYLRGEYPSFDVFYRTRGLLVSTGVLSVDNDYPRLDRVTKVSDLPADEIICLADPYCYISHLSAIQRYGLTDRRPRDLHITQLTHKAIKDDQKKRIDNDLADFPSGAEIEFPKLLATHHPKKVRKRTLNVTTTKNFGEWIKLRGSQARVSTIGQTFLDTLDHPELCGGMNHVLDIWKEHAKTYIEEIIAKIEETDKSILKVRAGYILEEQLGIKDNRILVWKQFAQRGGSRVLDPTKKFANTYSEDWMLSLNVG